MMVAMMESEFADTGALAMFWFNGLSVGKTGLPRMVGTTRVSSASSWGRALYRDRVRAHCRLTRRGLDGMKGFSVKGPKILGRHQSGCSCPGKCSIGMGFAKF